MPKLDWIGDRPSHSSGLTFAVPWAQGQCWSDGSSRLYCVDPSGQKLPLQSWNTAYWPDGSIKWTGHALPGLSPYPTSVSVDCVRSPPSSSADSSEETPFQGQTVTPIRLVLSSEAILVDTGKIRVVFPKSGASIVEKIEHSHSGKVVAENGHLVLRSQTSLQSEDEEAESSTTTYALRGQVSKAEVENSGPVRVVVRIEGEHQQLPVTNQRQPSAPGWLPFILRFYLYANSESVRIVHTIIYDQDPESHYIRGIGVRFHVPLEGEHSYNRHVRFAGVHGGIFGEAVQGVTGLWKDPGSEVRRAQVCGQTTPDFKNWNPAFQSRLQWIPHWNDFTLTQLSADGFTMKKRTKAGHSWVNIPGGTKADGLAYLGGANNGGLAVGMRHFWERYPTQIDVRNADANRGEITMWLYSPVAEPLDMRPYHDGLGQETYDEQLDALQITYEDWEPGTATPYGIGRTNELYLHVFASTPDNKTLSELVKDMQNPGTLFAQSEHIYQTKAFGNYWTPFSSVHSPDNHTPSPAKTEILRNLEFLFDFYKTQISQRRWYGFWDHGDIMHTYDADRNTWRYDIGGYAWDNSELSPDLWLWLYFLCTRRRDVFQIAEALTRHTSEVDTYHIGVWKGLGTRHGVQHWSDSCKQARVTNALYRKYFYYLTGGDERMGEIMRETLEVENTFLVLDPYRKVRRGGDNASQDPATISLGTDWSALAAGWMIEWERRGPQWEMYRRKLITSMRGIVQLKNAFVTGQALLQIETGNISPPPADADNRGLVQVSHLSAMFGLVETCAELIDMDFDDEEEDRGLLKRFRSVWLDYCFYFNATSDAQISRYGASFPKLILQQGHSRLTAYAARMLQNPDLARRAWDEFYNGDGYARSLPWKMERVSGSKVPIPIDEATWVSTNITALYGLAAIQGLAFGADYLHSYWDLNVESK